MVPLSRRSPRHRLRPLPRRPHRLDHTPDELTGVTTSQLEDRRSRSERAGATELPVGSRSTAHTAPDWCVIPAAYDLTEAFGVRLPRACGHHLSE